MDTTDLSKGAGLTMLTSTSHGPGLLPFPWYVLGLQPGNSGVYLQYNGKEVPPTMQQQM